MEKQHHFSDYVRVNSTYSRESSMESGKSSGDNQESSCCPIQDTKLFCRSLVCVLGSDKWRSSYLCLIGFLSSAFLGPGTGWLAACDSLQTISYKVETVLAFLLFLLSLALMAKPGRLIAWAWLVLGAVLIGASWYKYFNSVFGVDLSGWKDICMVGTFVWGALAFLPVVFTEPVIISRFF